MRVKRKDNFNEKESVLYDGYKEAFGLGLSSFMDRCGLSTKDIAEKLGVTDSSVSSWKKGRAFPDFPNYLRLVVLGMSPYEVMGRALECHARINDCKMKQNRNNADIDMMNNRSRLMTEEVRQFINSLHEDNAWLEKEIGELKIQLDRFINLIKNT